MPLPGPSQRVVPGSPRQHRSAVSPDNRVDLNHASLQQLMEIPGMKPTWAHRIIRFKPYRTKQSLIDEGIVSLGVYHRIRDYIIVHQDKD